MINKLDTLSPGKLSSGPVRRIESGAGESRSGTAAEAAPMRAGSSHGKTLLERASTQAHSAPDVDTARVSEVKAAIARGEFSIDPKAVARAFINMESS